MNLPALSFHINLSGFLLQTVKCGDYFQAEDGPREFGNISIMRKWIKSTDTSLLLRNLEVNYKEVRILYQFATVSFYQHISLWTCFI